MKIACVRRSRGGCMGLEITEAYDKGRAVSFFRFFLIVCLYSAPFDSAHSQVLPQDPGQAELKMVLTAAAENCEKLKNVALNFFCHENIREKTYVFNKTLLFRRSTDKSRRLSVLDDLRTIKTVKTSYVYDYQMIKSGDVLREKRDLLEENGKRRNDRDVEPKTLRMSAKYLVYGPVGFLSKSWQSHFRYEIIGTEIIGKKNAVIIKAVPREITEDNYCFGRIWVDESDMNVLQIEWEPQSIINFREAVDSEVGELKRKVFWKVAYGVVKNGIRFPSAQSIQEIYVTKNGKEHTKYEAEYIYDNYKFFTVETEVVLK